MISGICLWVDVCLHLYGFDDSLYGNNSYGIVFFDDTHYHTYEMEMVIEKRCTTYGFPFFVFEWPWIVEKEVITISFAKSNINENGISEGSEVE